MGIRVIHDEPRHTGGAGGCEKRIHKRCPFALFGGNGQGQKKCAHQNHDQKADCNRLRIAESIFMFFHF